MRSLALMISTMKKHNSILHSEYILVSPTKASSAYRIWLFPRLDVGALSATSPSDIFFPRSHSTMRLPVQCFYHGQLLYSIPRSTPPSSCVLRRKCYDLRYRAATAFKSARFFSTKGHYSDHQLSSQVSAQPKKQSSSR
jgi:hypothetical protein